MNNRFKMSLKKISALLTATLIACSLNGCATDSTISIDKDKDEETYNQVTAYASQLLMKYSYNLVDNLTYVELKNSDKVASALSDSEAENAFSSIAISSATNTDSSSSNSSEESNAGDSSDSSTDGQIDSSNTDNSTENDTTANESNSSSSGKSSDESANTGTSSDEADTSNAGSSNDSASSESSNDSDSKKESTSGDTNNTDTSLMDIQTALSSELNGLKLAYNGYSIRAAYPNMYAQGAVTASDGKKILLLDFALANTTSSDITLNILNKNATFKTYINGSSIGYSKVTMLMDDLSSYAGSVSAGSDEEVVLLFEVDEDIASSIESISLEISINGNSYSVALE